VRIAIKGAEGDLIAALTHAKDLREGLNMVSRLEVISLGVDQDADEITSRVVEPIGDVDHEPPLYCATVPRFSWYGGRIADVRTGRASGARRHLRDRVGCCKQGC
jgi:hypothetical protein